MGTTAIDPGRFDMVETYMNITKNMIVSFDYTLTNSGNQILDSSTNDEPLVYLHGHGNIIPGLELAMEGKTLGDTFKIRVPAADAYGERDEKLIFTLPLSSFGEEKVKEGMEFQAQTADGCQIVTVASVNGDQVTIDGNHPLAGQELNFDVTVKDIREASEEEIAHSHPHHAHHHGHGGCDGCGSCGGH
jgi:FKBP-type peptidyl-prolyl cis-trans isomerase SlyD